MKKKKKKNNIAKESQAAPKENGAKLTPIRPLK